MSETFDQTVSLDATQAIPGPVADRTQMSIGITCPVCSTANSPNETYCIDCGFLLSETPVENTSPLEPTPAKLVSADGTREFPLKQGQNSVGRKDADVLISDGTISRSHAVITVTGNAVLITDLGSTNGTQVDNTNIASNEEIALSDGSEIRFGSVVFKFVASIEPVDQSETAQMAEQESEHPEIETPEPDESSENIEDNQIEEAQEPEKVIYGVLSTKDGTQVHTITKMPCTIGRRDTNDIVVKDPYCSGLHANLEYSNGCISVTDAGSSNGTQVNGIFIEAQTPKILVEGDELTIGQTLFLFTEVFVGQ